MHKLGRLVTSWVLACLVILATTAAHGAHAGIATYDGINVHYRVRGAGGRALVFVHGWTCNQDFWDLNVSSFPGYRVVTLDLPGHGKSDKPHLDYSKDYFAGSIAAVLKSAGVDQAILIGHSMGARIIHDFYTKYPHKVLGMVFVDGMPWYSRKLERAQLKGIVDAYRLSYSTELTSSLESMLPSMQSHPKLRGYIETQMRRTPEHVGLSAMETMLAEDIREVDGIEAAMNEGRLESSGDSYGVVTVPTLAIFAAGEGGRFKWWPPDTEEFLRKMIKDLSFQEWDDVGHFLMMERPTAFNEVIGEFSSRVFIENSMQSSNSAPQISKRVELPIGAAN